MKILHTSDWHIGHKLLGRNRHQEFTAFFEWLTDCINTQGIDVLVVAGDIFDHQAPSNSSLRLYYSFLSKVSKSCCKHITIIGGNHDSPSLLNGPKELLQSLNIHIVPRLPESMDEELLLLTDQSGTPELLVLAVPFLHDRDIRTSVGGETAEEKQQKLLDGIYDHYATLCKIAEKKQQTLPQKVPVLATGHLFCRGAKAQQGDGMRELYVGSLIQVGLDCFPETIDYLALGHLHSAQIIGDKQSRRYSGSPLPMNINEGKTNKVVVVVDFASKMEITEIPVPTFQKMRRISGNLDTILEVIHHLCLEKESYLIEIEYKGKRLAEELQQQINEAVNDTQVEVLRIQNRRVYDALLKETKELQDLSELSPQDVFTQCLEVHGVPEVHHRELLEDFALVMEQVMAQNR